MLKCRQKLEIVFFAYWNVRRKPSELKENCQTEKCFPQSFGHLLQFLEEVPIDFCYSELKKVKALYSGTGKNIVMGIEITWQIKDKIQIITITTVTSNIYTASFVQIMRKKKKSQQKN